MPSSPALAYAAASLSTYRRLGAPRAVTSSCTPDRPSAIGTRMLDRPHTYRRSKFGEVLASARAIRDPKRDVTRCWPRGAQRMLHALAIVMLRGEYALRAAGDTLGLPWTTRQATAGPCSERSQIYPRSMQPSGSLRRWFRTV